MTMTGISLGRAAMAAAALLLAAPAAHAGHMERVPPVTDAQTRKECGECHMAFQPALLPAASWNRIMDGLSDHFGEDASLPADATAAIRAYLTQNAGRGDGRLMRITEQTWWLRHHHFGPAVWTRKDVKSKSNCAACHPDAAKGYYEEEDD